MITPKVKNKLKVPKTVLNEYIRKVASDPDRTIPLGELYGLDDITKNICKFNSENCKISELSQVVKKKRNASQPGLNQILYKVYKKCLRVMNYIFRITVIAVRDKVIPLNWHVVDGIMIKKKQNPRQSDLALGNVEGKLF